MKVFQRFILLVCMLILFSGCTQKAEMTVKNPNSNNHNSFIENSELGDDNLFYEYDYKKMDAKKIEKVKSVGVPYDAKWIQNKYLNIDQKVICLSTYCKQDTNFYVMTDDLWETDPLRVDLLDWFPEGGIIMSMTGMEENAIVLGIANDLSDANGEYQKYDAFCMNKSGELMWSVDLTGIIRREGIWEDAFHTGSILDSDMNNLFIASNEKLYVLDNDGELVMKYSVSIQGDVFLWDSFHMEDKQIVFSCAGQNQSELFCIDVNENKVKTMQNANYSGIRKYYGMWKDEVYYVSNGKMIRWNVVTGKNEIVTDLKMSGIEEVPGALMFLNEQISVYGKDKNGECIIVFGQNEPKIERGITIANINDSKNDLLRSGIAMMNREITDVDITYVERISEDERNRVLVEVSNGEGPDMLLVSREDFILLQSKHFIMEMSDYLDSDITDQLLPGARELGTIKDGLYGLPYDISCVYTMVTSRQTWDKDTWSLEDVTGLVNEKKDLWGIFLDCFGIDSYYKNTYLSIEYYVSEIATDKNFNYDKIKNMINDIKQKTKERTVEEECQLVREKKYLACQELVAGLFTYCALYKKVGPDMKVIGYPREDGTGNHLNTTDGILVINQACADKSEIKEIISYLFGLESQLNVGMSKDKISVRLDIPYLCLRKNGKQTITIDGKDMDMELFLEEYVEFLRGAEVVPFYPKEVRDIILEEADGFYHSDISIDQTMDVIKNRINLFLQE